MLDDTFFEREYHATRDRYIKQQDRLQAQEGFGSTDGGIAIVNRFLGDLVTTYEHHLALARHPSSAVSGLVPVLLQMEPRLLALCALQTLLHTLGEATPFGVQVQSMGKALEAECFRAGLTKADKRLAAAVALRVSKAGKRSVESKRDKARTLAAKEGFRLPVWEGATLVAAGGWLTDWVLSTLPHVFVIEGKSDNKAVVLAEGVLDIAQKAVDRCCDLRRVYLPRPEAPSPWRSNVYQGEVGPFTTQRTMVVRSRYQDVQAAVRSAIRDGSMAPALEGLNSLQAVPWRINRKVLLVQKACRYLGWDVEESLPGERLPEPECPKPWADMSDDERRLWWSKHRGTQIHNAKLISDRLSLAEDWAAADLYRDRPFWTPMNMDWRGRVYGITRFNFQREDRVRALFLLDKGEPIGEQGLDALLLHAANCWAGPVSPDDNRKTDKIPFEERKAWTLKHLDQISACSASPLTARWWMSADAPWLFLATCFELTSALTEGPSYITHLPVAFDGSCSGVQHLSLLTLAANEAAMVNLLPSNAPADVYAAVAAIAAKRIAADATATWSEDEAWKGEVAKLALAYGVDRKMAKRNTMTWAYSSKKFGMGGQQQEDLMDKLDHEVLLGKREVHPFAPHHRGSSDRPGKAARYLGAIFFEAIEQVMSLPGQAMLFLQGVAKTMAHEGKHVTWTSPSGLPCINRYNVSTTERLTLYTHIKGVKVKHQTLTATGEEATVDKDRASQGIAPNFVHSHDAAHVHLVARACAAEGIELATVHDSFACLPSRAIRMNAVLREQLVAMYEDKNLLQEARDRAYCALTPTGQQRLPIPPQQGALDVRQVLAAEFAFA